jgi:competence protein ComEC
VPIVKISRGDVLKFDNTEIEVLSPEFDANENAPSDNNHSIVLRISFGSRKILLTGDIESATEQILLQHPENLISDVIKVAHHGSKTSSTENFVQSSKVKFAVISVGRESPYGHPDKQVLKRWENVGTQILTTGENGTITFETDGEDLRLTTFAEQW